MLCTFEGLNINHCLCEVKKESHPHHFLHITSLLFFSLFFLFPPSYIPPSLLSKNDTRHPTRPTTPTSPSTTRTTPARLQTKTRSPLQPIQVLVRPPTTKPRQPRSPST